MAPGWRPTTDDMAIERSILCVAVAGLALLASGACAHDYGIENRETPVHVWITAPGMAAEGGTIDALVYLGALKVVEGPVTFPPGVPTVNLPTVYARVGEVECSAVLNGGAVTVRETVEIEGESWVQIIVTGRAATIELSEEQPSPWGR